MRRVSALACICAGLVTLFSLACPAAELDLSAGVELQGGRRTFTALDCDFVWDFGVSVPAVRYSFGASDEHLSLNGYWDGGETTDASVDPAFAAGHTKYQGDSYGRSNAWVVTWATGGLQRRWRSER